MEFTFNIFENSKEGWYSGYKEWCQFEKSNCQSCVINVAIQECVDTRSHAEITNLKYFFPLEDKIRASNSKVVVLLNIVIVDAEKYESNLYSSKNGKPVKAEDWFVHKSESNESKETYWRIKSFFQYYTALASNESDKHGSQKHSLIQISINGELIDHYGVTASRISPLLEVRNGVDSALTVANLGQNYYKNLKDKNLASKTDICASVFCEFLNNLLKSLILPSKFIGTNENPFNEQTKRAFSKELCDYFDHHLPQVSCTAQIIWLYLLQDLRKTKELFHFGAKPSLRVDLIEKSLFDSIAYAEGILQLLENSCLYSEGKSAWFGFRIHRAGRNQSMSEFSEECRTREYLYDKYSNCYLKDDKILPQNIFNEDYRYYIEIYVLDRAFDGIGVYDHYNNAAVKYNQLNPKQIEKSSLKDQDDIFCLMPRDPLISTKQDRILSFVQDVTWHYGLRWFFRIIVKNHGCFMLTSPGMTPHFRSLTRNNRFKSFIDEYCTEYSILLPISYKWEELRQELLPITDNIVYDDLSDKRNQLLFINIARATENAAKVDTIQNMKGVLLNSSVEGKKGITPEEIARLNSSIVVIEVPDGSKTDTECLAKALFGFLSYIYLNDEKCRPRIAVYLTENSLLYEFVRIFSVFYDKAGSQKVLSRSQIALCIKPINNKPPFVSLIIAGANIKTARQTVRQYLYFNSTATANMLTIADYLTDIEIFENGVPIRQPQISIQETTRIFPFELYLKNKELTEKEKTIVPTSPAYESWFLNQTKAWLLEDYQQSPYGCKISHTQIRVGSKVYLDTFYVAELLFHNPVITHHFAYLIALDLHETLKSIKNLSEAKVVILGYESYSAILVQQIKNILSPLGKEHDDSIYTAITLNTNYDESKIIYSSVNPFDEESRSLTKESSDGETEKRRDDCAANCMLITIIPIGTTLSTIQKMHNIFEKEMKIKTNIRSKNYCLVLSASYNENKDSIDNYWSYDLDEKYQPYALGDKQHQNTVFITPDMPIDLKSSRQKIQSSVSKIVVRYLINVESNWQIPFKEPSELNRSRALPLIEVDKASSNPVCIFSQRDKKIGHFDYDEKTNSNKLAGFYSKLYYSHIERGENHFQFYFDFKKFLGEDNNVIKVEEWLKEISQNIDSDAYNIIITPVNETISIFLKLVVSIIFHNQVRLLIIPSDNSYRESIRSKYSYIAEECEALRKNDPNYRINVYYVNDSIINGHSIERGLYLINMLLPGVLEKMKYTKILLLVNRSSFDTILRYVDNANRDLFAFIQLATPSYNMRNGTCPACDLKKKYERLRERSSTIVLANEFNRLAQKHELRDEEKYDAWMRNRIMISKSDFSRMVFWIYVFEKSGNTFDMSNALNEASKKTCPSDHSNIISTVSRVREILLKSKFSASSNEEPYFIDCLCINNDEKKVLVDFILNFVNASRDYLRLETMHKAYQKLIPIPMSDKYSSNIDLNDFTFEQMLALIAESLDKQTTQWELIKNAEWIISFIKVLSRDYIARYYHCRAAIYRIMLIITNYMLGDENYVIQERTKISSSGNIYLTKILHNVRNPTNSVVEMDRCPLLCVGMQYEIFMTLIHRLADLQSEFVFKTGTIESSLEFYNTLSARLNNQLEMTTDVFESFIYSFLPNKRIAEIRYLKAIKTAAMATNNDALSSVLYDSWKTLEESSKEKKSSSKPLKNATAVDENEDTKLPNYKYLYLENSQYLYKGLSELSERNQDNNVCKELLQGAYRSSKKESPDWLSETNLSYQNPFFFFCRMWHKTHNGRSPVSDKKLPELSEWNKLSNLLDYFRTTKDLFKKEIPIDEVPYQFEKICNALSGFSNFDMCYIVTHLKGYLPQIVSLSGYLVEYLEEQTILEREDMEHILSFVINYDSKGKEHPFGLDRILDGIYVMPQYKFPDGTRVKQEKYECQSLRVIRIGYAGEPEKEIQYYVILQNGIKKSKSHAQTVLDTLECAHGILCLRERFSLIIKKYSDALLSLRYDCAYIKFLEDSKKGGKPNILHLSDLHIVDDPDREERDKANILINIRGKIEEEIKDKKVDLLAITGDIVDCKVADATIVQNNYREAEKIILFIAKCLWAKGDDEGDKLEASKKSRLPHDWKRRIIVSPGNHDFAAMNLYKASLSKRALSAGVPSSGESGTMSKFTYFIEFMLHFLDAPVDEMIKNDLNDIRHYRNLKLSVFNLNALSVSSPIRTNKVGINKKKLNELLTRKNWKKQACTYKICTTHYSPNYKPNYILDAYDISLVQFSDEDHQEMYTMLKSEFNDVFMIHLDKLLKSLTPGGYRKAYVASDFYKRYFSDKEDKIWINCIPKGPAGDDKYNKFMHSDFMKELCSLNKLLLVVQTEDEASASEQINRMLDFLRHSIVVQESDAKLYKDLFNSIAPVDAILAGHVHIANTDSFKGTEKESKIYISGRTICAKSYRGDGSINCKLIEFAD